ncbi:MAG: translocation/assembly module TamB domain-containing protein, partial [Pseudomonadota bacterium]
RSDGKGGLLLSGKAQSGDGVIELQGNYDPAARKLDATIKGENFRVANAKRQRAEISPDINVKMDGDDINISGLLHIPTAFIDTSGTSGLVKESPDVVLVNGADAAAEESASRVTVDVRVTLGDDIKVKAGQFSGALAGELAVEQVPGGVPTGVGAIEVVSGDFIVYGQKLTMERGRVLFGGGPVTNPALEFDVAREVAAYDVKAGARIRGTAQTPILQLQSEPAQTDANTLSFILLGTPVDTAGVSYTFGKYITPDIYVSYERDLFTKVQTFSVRYRINNRLTLLASSSEDVSGSDLVYTWER